MPPLFASSPFAGFGLDSRTAGAPRGERIEADSRLRLKRGVREQCPSRPGVYGMVDEHGELIYVGKAKLLRPRLLSYFRTGAGAGKSRRILRRTKVIAWEYLPHELAALIRELELIRRWRPRFNVVGRPDPRKRVYVCLGRAPAPYLFLSTQVTNQCQCAWGPVPSGPRAVLAVKTLNDAYKLRDCPRPRVPMVFADHGHLFDPALTAGCLRYEIGDCLAPCAAACTRRQYGDRARFARRFLDGANDAATESLTRRMKETAQCEQFERAAGLRDQLESLAWLRETLERGERARQELSFVYPVIDADDQSWWYFIERGQPRSLVPLAATSSTQVRRLLKQIFVDKPCVGGPNDGQEDRELLWLVASWFRRNPAERERTLTPQAALAALGQRDTTNSAA